MPFGGRGRGRGRGRLLAGPRNQRVKFAPQVNAAYPPNCKDTYELPPPHAANQFYEEEATDPSEDASATDVNNTEFAHYILDSCCTLSYITHIPPVPKRPTSPSPSPIAQIAPDRTPQHYSSAHQVASLSTSRLPYAHPLFRRTSSMSVN